MEIVGQLKKIKNNVELIIVKLPLLRVYRRPLELNLRWSDKGFCLAVFSLKYYPEPSRWLSNMLA
jgi:hypothetical protein